MLSQLGSLILVAFLWGATNPLIKKGSRDIVKIERSNKFVQFLLEIKFLLTNFKYIIPMVFNQLGSVVYFFALQGSDISLAVPVANSLTFVFTALSGWALGEKVPGKRTFIGMVLVLLGTFLCFYDKYQRMTSTETVK